jgi:tripartite-type tricarboxylate transporter receptor subunit TctC
MIGYPFALPPGVPEDRVAIMRKAFDDTMKDPEFRDDMAKQKLEFTPKDGNTIAALVEQLAKTPAQVIERYKALVAAKTPG